MNNTGETIVKKWFNDYVNTITEIPKIITYSPFLFLMTFPFPLLIQTITIFQSNLIIFYSAKKELSVMSKRANSEQLISVHWKMLKKAFCR